MKALFTLLLAVSTIFVVPSDLQAQERFLDEVFTDVVVTDTIGYGINTTVLPALLGLPPQARGLFFNFYQPANDTMAERPLIMLFPTGNFLPPLVNGQVSGSTQDLYVRDLATRLASMGYVVAVTDHRRGWNPLSDVRETRVNTLINAAYRGVQDSRTCARFFRATAALQGNPFGIDPEKITIWGVGTGGYISQASATLDEYTDVLLPKFIGSDVNGDGTPDPMVILPIHGDLNAEEVGINPATGDTLCRPNLAGLGLSNEFQLCVNMGGALGDISWLDENDPPMIGFHVPTDPNAPYQSGVLIVPTTGELVVEVQGSGLVGQTADDLGVNDVFKNATFNDPITEIASQRSGGLSAMMPLPRPDWPTAQGGVESVESGPWETWDAAFWSQSQPQDCIDMSIPLSACNWHLVSLAGNPDMSLDKGELYLDTILQYFAPRGCVALDLPCAEQFLTVSTTEINLDASLMTIAPNPAVGSFLVSTENHSLEAVTVYDLRGQTIIANTYDGESRARIDVNGLQPGMYIVKANVEDGVITQRVMIQ